MRVQPTLRLSAHGDGGGGSWPSLPDATRAIRTLSVPDCGDFLGFVAQMLPVASAVCMVKVARNTADATPEQALATLQAKLVTAYATPMHRCFLWGSQGREATLTDFLMKTDGSRLATSADEFMGLVRTGLDMWLHHRAPEALSQSTEAHDWKEHIRGDYEAYEIPRSVVTNATSKDLLSFITAATVLVPWLSNPTEFANPIRRCCSYITPADVDHLDTQLRRWERAFRQRGSEECAARVRKFVDAMALSALANGRRRSEADEDAFVE